MPSLLSSKLRAAAHLPAALFVLLALCLAGPVRTIAADRQAPARIVSLSPLLTENVFLLGAGDRGTTVSDAHLAPDRLGGLGVVPGDHLDADSRRLRLPDRRNGLGSRRVEPKAPHMRAIIAKTASSSSGAITERS